METDVPTLRPAKPPVTVLWTVFVALAAKAAEDIQGEPREEVLRVANASALHLFKMWTGGMPTPSQPG